MRSMAKVTVNTKAERKTQKMYRNPFPYPCNPPRCPWFFPSFVFHCSFESIHSFNNVDISDSACFIVIGFLGAFAASLE